MLNKVRICYAPLSDRVVLGRFGKCDEVALERKDAMNAFWQALVAYSFNGKMPDEGQAAMVSFGGGDEQFEVVVTRVKK